MLPPFSRRERCRHLFRGESVLFFWWQPHYIYIATPRWYEEMRHATTHTTFLIYILLFECLSFSRKRKSRGRGRGKRKERERETEWEIRGRGQAVRLPAPSPSPAAPTPFPLPAKTLKRQEIIMITYTWWHWHYRHLENDYYWRVIIREIYFSRVITDY